MDVNVENQHFLMMLRELSPDEFTPELEPVFRHVEAEAAFSKNRGNPKYFFSNWQHLMRAGIARTWADEGCVLGALFFPDVYNGERRAAVQYWFSLPDARGTGRPVGLLNAFETAAKQAGCQTISIASYETLSPEKTERIYQKRGYVLTERTFSKQV